MATNKPRFSVTFEEESYRKIQEYRKENGISTQSKAVARLIEIALNEIYAEGQAVEDNDCVLRKTLLENFDQLNREGQENLVETSDDMVLSGKYIKSNPVKMGEEAFA